MDIFASFLTPILIIFLGYYIKYKPSHKIGTNGYDTKTSRKSQETWDYAQKIAPIYCLRLGYTFLLINLLSYVILSVRLDSLVILIAGAILGFLCMFLVFYVVDFKINKKINYDFK